jgi:hypothetical protein
VMWGTDATRFYTERDGWCWWFGAIDHASDDIVGGTWRRSAIGGRRSNRFARARAWPSGPLPKTSRGASRCGAIGVPRYIADALGNELAWLGITHSHSFVREPQRRDRAIHRC